MASETKSDKASYNPNELPDLLPMYYRMFFPSNLFQSWLSYSDDKNIPSPGKIRDEENKDPVRDEEAWKIKQREFELENSYFARREFSFTLPGDIFVRYKSFIGATELTNALKTDLPIKFDIGAVFSANPKLAKKARENSVVPVERELVFDIDMTDYDEIRTCCQGASVCSKCWRFMAIAAKILDTHLRSDFGFKHILWVYSGRRGIHCWVCDERARKLSNEGRNAIVTYLSIIEGGAYKSKRVNLLAKTSKLHPMIVKSVELIEPYFEAVLEEQNVLKTKEDVQSFIKLFGNTQVQALLKSQGSRCDFWSKKSAGEKYKTMAAIAATHFKGSSQYDLGRFYDQEIKLQYCYPRLDINVTKGINHLLKAPFCVHPKTGRVCIPFDLAQVDKFDPATVPTIQQIMYEVEEFDKANASTETEKTKKSAIEKTSLNPSIRLFTKFVNDLRLDRVAKAKKASAKSLDFWIRF